MAVVGDCLWRRYNLCDVNRNNANCNGTYGAPPSELAIKSGWWGQVYGNLSIASFPNIKLVHWFDIKKVEVEAQSNTGEEWAARWGR